jgi:hypothetical protein
MTAPGSNASVKVSEFLQGADPFAEQCRELGEPVSSEVHERPSHPDQPSTRTARTLEPTSSMPSAGVVLVAYAGWRPSPYLQGVLAFLVTASWTRFETVVARGRLPKSFHGGRWSGGLLAPLPRCSLRLGPGSGSVAAPGPSDQSAASRDWSLRVIHSPSMTRRCQHGIEHLFYSSQRGEQSSVHSRVAAEPDDAPLLGSTDGLGAWTVARSDPGVATYQFGRLGCTSDVRTGSPRRPFDRGLVCLQLPATHRRMAKRGNPSSGLADAQRAGEPATESYVEARLGCGPGLVRPRPEWGA